MSYSLLTCVQGLGQQLSGQHPGLLTCAPGFNPWCCHVRRKFHPGHKFHLPHYLLSIRPYLGKSDVELSHPSHPSLARVVEIVAFDLDLIKLDNFVYCVYMTHPGFLSKFWVKKAQHIHKYIRQMFLCQLGCVSDFHQAKQASAGLTCLSLNMSFHLHV